MCLFLYVGNYFNGDILRMYVKKCMLGSFAVHNNCMFNNTNLRSNCSEAFYCESFVTIIS